MSDAAAPKKKGMVKMLVFAVVFLIVAGGAAAGGYWYFQQNAAQAAEAADAGGEHAEDGDKPAKKRKKTDGPVGLITFEPFLVNLADQGATRYLRANIKLVVSEELAAEAKEKEVVLMRLRSAILELLAEQTADPLVTPEGKAALKQAIQERVGDVADAEVADVLFSDFVVQF